MKIRDRLALQPLDRKIAEIVQELRRLEATMLQRKSELRTLRAARAVVAGGASPAPARSLPAADVVAARQQLFPDCVFSRATQVLEEVGQPLHVNELTAQLRTRGYRINGATLVGALARAAKRGWIRRVAPNVFDVALPGGLPQKPGLASRSRTSRAPGFAGERRARRGLGREAGSTLTGRRPRAEAARPGRAALGRPSAARAHGVPGRRRS